MLLNIVGKRLFIHKNCSPVGYEIYRIFCFIADLFYLINRWIEPFRTVGIYPAGSWDIFLPGVKQDKRGRLLFLAVVWIAS